MHANLKFVLLHLSLEGGNFAVHIVHGYFPQKTKESLLSVVTRKEKTLRSPCRMGEFYEHVINRGYDKKAQHHKWNANGRGALNSRLTWSSQKTLMWTRHIFPQTHGAIIGWLANEAIILDGRTYLIVGFASIKLNLWIMHARVHQDSVHVS